MLLTQTQNHTHTHAHTHTHMYPIPLCWLTTRQSSKRLRTHTHTHTHRATPSSHPLQCTYTHLKGCWSNRFILTYTHTHTHTHIYIYIYIYIYAQLPKVDISHSSFPPLPKYPVFIIKFSCGFESVGQFKTTKLQPQIITERWFSKY